VVCSLYHKKTPYTQNHIIEDFSNKLFTHTQETTTIEKNNEKEVTLQVLLVGNSPKMRTNKIQNRHSICIDIELQKMTYFILFLVYSQMWLSISKDDHHFFDIFYGDCHFGNK
jgi:hypothetical protein